MFFFLWWRRDQASEGALSEGWIRKAAGGWRSSGRPGFRLWGRAGAGGRVIGVCWRAADELGLMSRSYSASIICRMVYGECCWRRLASAAADGRRLWEMHSRPSLRYGMTKKTRCGTKTWVRLEKLERRLEDMERRPKGVISWV